MSKNKNINQLVLRANTGRNSWNERMILLILKISWKMHRRIPYKIPRLWKKLLPIIVSDLTVRQISICYFVYTEIMMCHNPDLGSASDWMKQISNQSEVLPDLGSGTISVWISVLVSQMSFHGETTSSMAKCQLFSQANHNNAICFLFQTSWIHISWDQSKKTFTSVFTIILLM